MINHHYPILNQCSSHHQPVDFSSTYPKLRVTCPSLANLAVSEHRVCPRPKTSRLKGFPKKTSTKAAKAMNMSIVIIMIIPVFHRSPGLPRTHHPIYFHMFSTACHQGDHPAVFHTKPSQLLPSTCLGPSAL